jgi:hypothetical protein
MTSTTTTVSTQTVHSSCSSVEPVPPLADADVKHRIRVLELENRRLMHVRAQSVHEYERRVQVMMMFHTIFVDYIIL